MYNRVKYVKKTAKGWFSYLRVTESEPNHKGNMRAVTRYYRDFGPIRNPRRSGNLG